MKKTGKIDEISEDLRGSVPQRGIFIHSDSYEKKSGAYIVDFDQKDLKFKNKDGQGIARLNDDELEKIENLFEKIWKSDSKFESKDIPAKVMFSILILVKDKEYTMYDFNSFFGGEVKELYEFIIGLMQIGGKNNKAL